MCNIKWRSITLVYVIYQWQAAIRFDALSALRLLVFPIGGFAGET